MQEDAVTNDENATHRCDLLCPVAHLMRAVPFVDPESTLRTAAQAMVAQGDGVAVVLGPEGPARIVTEHDIVCALAQQADPNTVWVADVAPSNLISAELTATILDVIRQMACEHVRHIAVKANGEVVGVVVAEDIVDLPGGSSIGTRAT
jgi:signal-transduction protein with cAMP-binding, CBS, and nucleotidyltransferase domain